MAHSTTKQRRRRRKRHYHTGIYKSRKCPAPIEYRSGWEYEVCRYLDKNVNVVAYLYEAVAIPYVSNVRTHKVRRYYPDFIIKYKDGRIVVVEVKRADKLNGALVKKKTFAGQAWARENNVEYEVWTDPMIMMIKKFNDTTRNDKRIKSIL